MHQLAATKTDVVLLNIRNCADSVAVTHVCARIHLHTLLQLLFNLQTICNKSSPDSETAEYSNMTGEELEPRPRLNPALSTFLLLGFVLGRLLFAAAAAAVGSLRHGDAVHAAVLEVAVHVWLVLLALRSTRQTFRHKPFAV